MLLGLTRREARLALLQALEEKYPEHEGKLLHGTVDLIIEGPAEEENRPGDPNDLAVEAHVSVID